MGTSARFNDFLSNNLCDLWTYRAYDLCHFIMRNNIYFCKEFVFVFLLATYLNHINKRYAHLTFT